MRLSLFRRFKYGKQYKDIGSFDTRPTKYSTEHTFEPLQRIRLGKYESYTRELMKRILWMSLSILSLGVLAWIVFESLRALFVL